MSFKISLANNMFNPSKLIQPNNINSEDSGAKIQEPSNTNIPNNVGTNPKVSISFQEQLNQSKLSYPESKKIPTKEMWHGIEIADDYSWLENTNEEVGKWTQEQNTFTRQVLDSIPNREQMKKDLRKWLEIGDIKNIATYGNKTFQWRRTRDENHAVLYVKDKATNIEEVLLNPNTMSSDGTRAVDWTSISHDGNLIAYGTSDGGTEKSILRIKDVNTKQDLKDEIPNTRACAVGWMLDNSGFFYTRYPKTGTVPEGEENYHRSIYFHRLGSSHETDQLIFKPKDPYKDWPNIGISEDGKWGIVSVSRGWSANDVYIGEINITNPENTRFKPLFEGKENHLNPVIYKNHIYMMTDLNASRFKVMRVSVNEPDLSNTSKWEEFIPEDIGTLENHDIIGGKLLLSYKDKAFSRLDVVNVNDKSKKSIPLPSIGTVESIRGKENSSEMFFSFESFTTPTTIYKADINSLTQEKVCELNISEDLSEIETEQVTYNSKDGTPVTMFLVHKKDLVKDGENKTKLYGYGGFNSGLYPWFMKSAINWISKGGILAIPNLRGGNEYGEEWHKDGMLDKKQNVFDDFISAAEYLIKEKYTKPSKLVIQGGSNGGLLVGAALVQRPDLFGAVICQVPLLDMIHYDKTHIAKLWQSEYGDPTKPEDFKVLYAYSPYHNVKDGIDYPAVLLATADGDSRVDPMHAKKMAAKLQEASSSNKPILLHVDKQAGHGAGKPINKILEDLVDIEAFLKATLS